MEASNWWRLLGRQATVEEGPFLTDHVNRAFKRDGTVFDTREA